MSEPLRTVNVGLIGLGTVGGGVARLIKSHHDEYLAAYGIDLKLPAPVRLPGSRPKPPVLSARPLRATGTMSSPTPPSTSSSS